MTLLRSIPATAGLVLQLTVDLMMENSREFVDDFVTALQADPEHVALDFSKTRFIDSSGIGALLKCSDKRNEKRDGHLIILGLNRQMLSVFKLAGLYKVFDVVEGEEETRRRFPELF